MSRLYPVALAATFALCAMSTAAFAAGSKLQLVIGGEAYDGPPKFEVTFDGKVVGDAAVAAAIDTGSAGRFADAEDKTPYVESFELTIPDDVFKPDGEVRVRLTNEAYGGEGSNRDRNLFLAAVIVNGRPVTVSGLATKGSAPDIGNELVGEFLLLKDGNVEGVSKAPEGGWPQPATDVATAPAAPVADTVAEPAPTEAAADPAVVEPAPAEAAAAPAVPAPAVTSTLTVPQAEAAPVASDEPTADEAGTDAAGVDEVKTASIESEPVRAATPCTREEIYNIIGFNENSNDLTPKLRDRLNQVIADIGTQKCKVQVTGYSSKQGALDLSALFATERAQKVLAYLRQNGLSFVKATAAGGGATDQFGETPAPNRRVVITVSP